MADMIGTAWFLAFGAFCLAMGLRRKMFERVAGRSTRMTYDAARGSIFMPKSYESYVRLTRTIAIVGGMLSIGAAAAIALH